MEDQLNQQLQKLGIKYSNIYRQSLENAFQRIDTFRQELWSIKDYHELIMFARKTISSELSRKLEHVINPPKALGLAEEISLESIKWLLEYWWKRNDNKSPDLAVSTDNNLVAYWHEPGIFIQIRFFSNGFVLVSVKHHLRDKKHKDKVVPMNARDLPINFD